jgi:tetratricopeptide (TPR) repeat protein
MKKFCLSMIVKNEEKILARCLKSVLPVLSCYEVTDTGSTDRTCEIVREVLEGIPGHVNSAPFKDFSQARNAALNFARQSLYADLFDHILLIDADMELVCRDVEAFLKEVTQADVLHLTQKSSTLSYENVRVVRRTCQAAYRGRTHEYVDLPPNTKVGRVKSAYMIDHACGSSRVEKFERDLRLLKEELEEDPKNVRAAFYLAQTYKDMGKVEEAANAYAERAKMGGWSEEIYLCHLYRGRVLLQMGKEAEGLAALGQAYETNPARAEAVIELAKAHRLRGRNELACLFAEATGNRTKPPDGALFVEMPAYDYAEKEELSISGFYSKLPYRKVAGRKACIELTTARSASHQARELARRNSLHYARPANEVFPGSKIVSIQGEGVRAKPGFSPMNPSICTDEDGTLRAIVRTVNYSLDGTGNYVYASDGVVRTENYIGTLDPETGLFKGEFLSDESGEPKDESSRVRGYEDIRLFRWQKRWWGLASVRDFPGSWQYMNEIVLLEIEGKTIRKVYRLCPGTKRCEKNWVPLVREDKDGELWILYSLDPMRWLRFEMKDDAPKVKEITMVSSNSNLALDHLRGGTRFVSTGEGTYQYLAHESIDGMGRRKYMHRLVTLDEESLAVTSVSEPFFFEDRTIEFASGLATQNGRLVAGFGSVDREAKLLVFQGVFS